MPNELTGSGTKQGDHVFNDLETAVAHPVESMRQARLPGFDGDRFLLHYLPYGTDLGRRILRDPIWAGVRQYVATPGQEQDALRRLRRVAPQRLALQKITEQKLVRAHLDNAAAFGEAAARFEYEFLAAMRHALTVATERPNQPGNSRLIFGEAKPVLSFQALINTAFDPAAALIVLIDRADRENALGQGGILNLVEAIWNTIEPARPALWADPWNHFREPRPALVVKVIADIRTALNSFPALKVRGEGEILQSLSEAAAGHAPPLPQEQRSADFGYMIAALTRRIEQLRAQGKA